MGTLFEQRERAYIDTDKDDVVLLLTNAIKIAKDLKVDLNQVLTVYHIKELERQNDLSVNNGNIHDEQMAGMGEILQEICDKLRDHR